jgi:hypothetical protein
MSNGHVAKPINTEIHASSQSTASAGEDRPNRFASLLTSITPQSIVSLAIRIRYKGDI